jgi:hypothetical protein
MDATTSARFGAVMQPEILFAKDKAFDSVAEPLAERRALIKGQSAKLNSAEPQVHSLSDQDSEALSLEERSQATSAEDHRCFGILPAAHQQERWHPIVPDLDQR